MRRKTIPSVVLRLYPRAWRARYGEELLGLVDELFDAHNSRSRVVIDIALSGLAQRGQAAFRSRRTTVTMGAVALLLMPLAALNIINSESPSHSPGWTSVVGEGNVFPVDVPGGPVASVSDCPFPPKLSNSATSRNHLSISVSLVPPGSASVTVGNKTYDLSNACEYTIRGRS